MIKLKISSFLENCEQKLEDLNSSSDKANSLYKLCQNKKNQLSDINLQKGADEGLVEMIDEMIKFEKLEEIKLAMYLLEHFIKNNSFNPILVDKSFDRENIERFETIKNRIKVLILD